MSRIDITVHALKKSFRLHFYYNLYFVSFITKHALLWGLVQENLSSIAIELSEKKVRLISDLLSEMKSFKISSHRESLSSLYYNRYHRLAAMSCVYRFCFPFTLYLYSIV